MKVVSRNRVRTIAAERNRNRGRGAVETFSDLLQTDSQGKTDTAGVVGADSADPFAGDLWHVALLGLHPNGSRRWPATQGVVDFRPIELPRLWESVKD